MVSVNECVHRLATVATSPPVATTPPSGVGGLPVHRLATVATKLAECDAVQLNTLRQFSHRAANCHFPRARESLRVESTFLSSLEPHMEPWMAAIPHRLRYEMLEGRRMTAADVVDSIAITLDSSQHAGLRAAEIQLQYDARALDLDAADIRLGDAWADRASLVSHIDKLSGAINIFVFSAQPIEGESGGLLDLQFEVTDALVADVSLASIRELTLNEGAIESQVVLRETIAADDGNTSIAPQPLLRAEDHTPVVSPTPETKACTEWDADQQHMAAATLVETISSQRTADQAMATPRGQIAADAAQPSANLEDALLCYCEEQQGNRGRRGV